MIDGFGAQFVVPGFVAVDLAQPVRGAVLGQPRRGIGRARCRPRPPTREQTCRGWPPSGRLPLPSRTSRPPRGAVAPGTPGNASHCRRRTRPRRPRHRLRPGAGHRAEPESRLATPGISSSKTVVPSGTAPSASPSAPRCSPRRRRRWRDRAGASDGVEVTAVEDEDAGNLVAEGCGDRRDDDQQAGDTDPANPDPTGRCSCWFAVGHAASQGSAVLPARMRFSICRRYAPARSIGACAC